MAVKPTQSWLDNSFIEKALRTADDPTITVLSSELKRATADGDNYTSELYRANVKFTRKGKEDHRSLIIKCSLSTNDYMSELLSKTQHFEKEINTFNLVHPEVIRLLKQAFKQNYEPFTANYIHCSTHENGTTIFLEDLKEQGFKLAETKLGLDLKHCLLVMRKLAKYHAATVAAHHEKPDCFKPFLTNVYTQDTMELMAPFFITSVRGSATEIGTWPDYKERYGDKLNKLIDTVVPHWSKALKVDDTEFKVLIHGDLSSNNIMFKYSEETGEVEDVRFVDFQMILWSSPAVDLHYFMNSSASPELLENHQVLINEYFNTLTETFTLLGYEHLKPSASHINERFEKRGTFGVLAAICLRSIVLADRTKVPDMNKVSNKEGSINLSEPYKQSMRTLLPLYEKRGWI